MRQKLTILLTCLLLFCICLTGCGDFNPVSSEENPVYAEEVVQDGLEITLETDKTEYRFGEEGQSTLTVTNVQDNYITDITLEQVLPKGAELIEGSKEQMVIEQLQTGESVTLSVAFMWSFTAMLLDMLCIFGPILAIAILLIVVIVITVKKRKSKKMNKQLIAMLMSIVLLEGLLSPLMPVLAEAQGGVYSAVTVSQEVKVSGISKLISGNVKYSVNQDSAKEPMENESSDSAENTVVIRLVSLLDDVFLEKESKLEDIVVEIGTKPSRPADPKSNVAEFQGWYTNLSMEEEYHFDTPIFENLILFAKWEVDETDTDGDEIYDAVEKKIGTDILQSDSDGDGLSDYMEKYIGTDPLLMDTDENGITDYNEDEDGDQLTNGYEVEIGTDLLARDSDYDGLNDYDELNVYSTDPLKEDTDEDGATDAWEINNGTDPLVADAVFVAVQASEEVTEYNLVSAKVELQVSGEQADTLRVERVNMTDNHLIRSSLPGYMGTAYDFTVEGMFEEATITFSYNTDVFGVPNEEFQPCIYFVNEETQCYEELENQTITDGKVSAKVSHFSTYILLNKVEFDKIWEQDIKPVMTDNAGYNIVLALDNSGSMADNDPNNLRYDLVEGFVSKLGPNDMAGLIYFQRWGHILSDLTNDYSQFRTLMDGLVLDDGKSLTESGTGSAEALRKTRKMFPDDGKKRIVVLLTDGADTWASDTNKVIKQMQESNITVYTVGFGDVDTTKLQRYADETGGKYYYASTVDELNFSFDNLSEQFEDTSVDSNGDGITDYHANLIYEGLMPLGEHLRCYDFESSADSDGDGLLNGEEIKVVEEDGRIYLVMTSDPRLKHSDIDGVNDYDEVKRGTDPLKDNVSKGLTDSFLEEANYYFTTASKNIKSDKGTSDILSGSSFVFGVWNKEELYRDIMVQYFVDYVKEDALAQTKAEETLRNMSETLLQMAYKYVKQEFAEYGMVKNIYECLDEIHGFPKTTSYMVDIPSYKIVFDKMAVEMPDGMYTFKTVPTVKPTTKWVDVVDVTKKMDMLSTGVTIVSGAIDVVDTIETFNAINANSALFNAQMDILEEWSAASSEIDDHAWRAARKMKETLEEGYWKNVSLAVAADVGEVLGMEALNAIVSSIPYCKAVLFARDVADMVTGISEDIKQTYEMYCYAFMFIKTGHVFYWGVVRQGDYYVINDRIVNSGDDLNRYLTHAAQIAVRGEYKYYEFYKPEGIFGFFDKAKEEKENVENNIELIRQMAELLEININSKVYE